jgi:GNAT superfamily N-acetyltransferase
MASVPWTQAQKRAFVESQFAAQTVGYAERHPDAAHEIVLLDNSPVGRLYLSRKADGLHILDVTIEPAHRNQGIGSQVLNEIIEEADRARKPVTIYTETFNPSTRFFDRLGFRTKSQDGFMLLLERPAAVSGSDSSTGGRL